MRRPPPALTIASSSRAAILPRTPELAPYCHLLETDSCHRQPGSLAPKNPKRGRNITPHPLCTSVFCCSNGAPTWSNWGAATLATIRLENRMAHPHHMHVFNFEARAGGDADFRSTCAPAGIRAMRRRASFNSVACLCRNALCGSRGASIAHINAF